MEQNFQTFRCNGAKHREVEATPFRICNLETSHPNKSLLHQILGWKIEEEKPKLQNSDVSPEEVFKPNMGSSNAEDCQADGVVSDDQDTQTPPASSPETETFSTSKFLCVECQPPHTFNSVEEVTEHMSLTDHTDIDAIGSE